MTTVYQTPFVKIFYDEAVPVVYEEWMGQISGKEFKLALEEKLKVYKKYKQENKPLFWLNDVRKLRGVSDKVQHWAVDEFHPNLFKAGVKKVAFIVPSVTYVNLSDEEITGKLDARNEINICYFDDFESACRWFNE